MMEGERSNPTPLSDLLTDLFTIRGYNRLMAVSELEQAWNDAVGQPACSQTRISGLKRGVLSVTVAHPILLEELAGFQKSVLLSTLRQTLPGTPIHDIRFRVGSVQNDS